MTIGFRHTVHSQYSSSSLPSLPSIPRTFSRRRQSLAFDIRESEEICAFLPVLVELMGCRNKSRRQPKVRRVLPKASVNPGFEERGLTFTFLCLPGEGICRCRLSHRRRGWRDLAPCELTAVGARGRTCVSRGFLCAAIEEAGGEERAVG